MFTKSEEWIAHFKIKGKFKTQRKREISKRSKGEEKGGGENGIKEGS